MVVKVPLRILRRDLADNIRMGPHFNYIELSEINRDQLLILLDHVIEVANDMRESGDWDLADKLEFFEI